MRQDTHLCIINIITHTRILPSLLPFGSLEASHIEMRACLIKVGLFDEVEKLH